LFVWSEVTTKISSEKEEKFILQEIEVYFVFELIWPFSLSNSQILCSDANLKGKR